MTENTSFPLTVRSLRRSISVSESLEESPDVGSSINNTDGSLISSSAIFSLFLWPPLITLLNGLPTLNLFFEQSEIHQGLIASVVISPWSYL